MPKRYSTLQKKLHELESELNELFSLPPETPYFNHFTQDIEQRFVFLNNLLSAETASRPKKPHHLTHIVHRLGELETWFHKWHESKALAQDHIETGSTCSCTESCLNEEEEDGKGSLELDSPGFEDLPEKFVEAVDEEKEGSVEMEMETGEANKGVKREEERVVWVGKFCGVMTSGVVLGMVFMGLVMVGFSGCFDSVERGILLIPT